ncbi:MAG: peptidoglycan-binding protein [Rhizobiaceae bacterium]
MARSARLADPVEEEKGLVRSGVDGLVAFAAQRPGAVGGGVAFIVALSFVSANALWYQPHQHRGAFFATRSFPAGAPQRLERETVIRIERPEAAAVSAPVPAPMPHPGDPRVERVQTVLRGLRIYQGEIDGLNGPATRKAVETYQARLALPVTGVIDSSLLASLGVADETTASVPPSPTPRPQGSVLQAEGQATQASNEERIKRIQGGLRAFGNAKIEIDGLIGSRTRAALKEFQSLFGLQQTGEPDEAVYAKMREIGLAN